jgi:hypothetical protein
MKYKNVNYLLDLLPCTDIYWGNGAEEFLRKNMYNTTILSIHGPPVGTSLKGTQA